MYSSNPIGIQAKKKSDTAVECYLYGDIGGFGGITADTFRSAIESLGDFKSLVMYVNSPGGSVFDGKAIVAQLERIRQHAAVTAVVDGIAASAASFIAIAADEVVMHPSARMMIHLPNAIAAGGAEDFRKMADLLESETDSLVAMYQRKTGMDEDRIREMLVAETWMTAEEAVSMGFADKIAEPPAVKADAKTAYERLAAQTKALTSNEEVKRRAAFSRALRVVETMRAKCPNNPRKEQ